MNDKALFVIILIGTGLTAAGAVAAAFVEFKAPNRLTDVLKTIVKK